MKKVAGVVGRTMSAIWKRRPKMKAIGEFFAIFANLATVAVALLAFWAYFFTSLPDDLARQFRTEIADLNEQLVDLRQQRRNLDSEVGSARQDIAMLYEERRAAADELQRTRRELEDKAAAMAAELGASQNSLDATKADLARLAESRSALVREIVAFKLEGVIADVSGKVGTLRGTASLASSYIAYKEWLADRKEVGKPADKSTEAFLAWSARHSRWMDRMPRTWSIWELRYGGWDRDATAEEVDDLAALFRSKISESNGRVTGAALIREEFAGQNLGALSVDDRKRLKKFVEDYLSERKKIFDQDLAVSVPVTAPDQAVVDLGRVRAAQFQMLEEALQAMPTIVAARFLD